MDKKIERMKKLKEKKGEHKMHPLEQKAKMGVVHDMQKMAHDAMGSKLKGLNKVSVASDSPEGLEHGLENAHDVLKHLPQALDDSHHDHENAALTENKEDGNDGMDSFPDADDAHQLEANPLAQHHADEAKEGEMMAEGGEVNMEDENSQEESEEHGGMLPDYENMDEGEMDSHLAQLVAALKKRGRM